MGPKVARRSSRPASRPPTTTSGGYPLSSRKDLISNFGTNDLWIGLHIVSGNLEWVSGEVVGYTNWCSGEPDPGETRFFMNWCANGGWGYSSGAGTSAVIEKGAPPRITSFSAEPISGAPPLDVDFTCDAYSPNDGGTITEYRWDFDNNGTIDDTTEENTTSHTYSSIASWYATVTVVDDAGLTTKSKPGKIVVGYGPDLTGAFKELAFHDFGHGITVDFQVDNVGSIPADAFKVHFYLSNDGSRPIFPCIKTFIVSGGLAAGESTVLSFTKSFVPSMYGKYIQGIIDRAAVISEMDETNNRAVGLVKTWKPMWP